MKEAVDDGWRGGGDIADVGLDETGEGDDGIRANKGSFAGHGMAQMLGQGGGGNEQTGGFGSPGEGIAKEGEGMAG